MTLDAFIATHPALWDRMVAELDTGDPANLLPGMIEAVAIVGQFSRIDIVGRLGLAIAER